MTATRARLLYDSSRSRALVGVRAGLTDGRSLSYCGSEVTVDVVLNAEDRDAGFLFGQVVRNDDGSPIADAEVEIDSSQSVQTDECGQFALATGAVRSQRVLYVRTSADHLACTIVPMR